MPYRIDNIAIKDPFLDSRIRLLPCQKEMIKWWSERGESSRKIASRFKVSRRSVQFIIDPEKIIQNKKRREERGGTKKYYDKTKHKEYMKKHRRYKHSVIPNYPEKSDSSNTTS